MKVNYTLPGLLPEPSPGAAAEPVERPKESFGAQLDRLRAPDSKDWRAVLHLNAEPAGAFAIGPPPAAHGIPARDGMSQRAWWRGMLARHAPTPGTAQPVPVRRMMALLNESQRLEDEVFARHFAEERD